jgi:hypothetical protein
MNSTIERETKVTNNTDQNHHEVLVRTKFPQGTGAVKFYTKSHLVKWGMVERWIEANPKLEVVKIFDIVKKI